VSNPLPPSLFQCHAERAGGFVRLTTVHRGVTKARRQEGEVGAMRTAREASGTIRISRRGKPPLIDRVCGGRWPWEWSLRQSVPFMTA
jgi:stage III sporulation protein SpoIIIAA